MESWSIAHKNLQIFCADFWPSPDDCAAILEEIGISSNRINMSEPSIMRWLSIIKELMRKNDGSMAKLVVALVRQYPNNSALLAVCAPWIPSLPARSTVGEHMPTPAIVTTELPPGAVLVQKFEPGFDLPPEPKPEVPLGPKVAPNTDGKTAVKPELKPEGKAEVKSDSKPDPKPAPDPVPSPVAAPPDSDEDLSLLVARVDTLWAAMVDTEQRVVELERLRLELQRVYAVLEKIQKPVSETFPPEKPAV